MVKNVIESFNSTVEKAKELEKEFSLLLNIKSNVQSSLTDVIDEIKGLEKALSFSSISSEARKAIEEKVYEGKLRANHYAYLLGESRPYEVKKN
uniref:Uncharacterized protein n=1 Tax=viral metagenome TaxID=1070528 RepID=A0A6M3L988_9ZZZZ